MELRLLKVQGSGKEFFLIDETELKRPLTETEILSITTNLCNRSTGPLSGADGVLLVQESETEDTMNRMRVLNSDGSEAAMCGNGLRVVGRYLAEKNQCNNFLVETIHADLKVRQTEDLGKNVSTFQIEVSPVSFLARAISMAIDEEETIINAKIPELSDDLLFTAVAVPNPHLIAFVDHEIMTSEEQKRIADIVNNPSPLFPDGINISFVEVLDEHLLFVKSYERGIGYIDASGTGMCASSLVYVLLYQGEFCEPIWVKNPGGIVKTVVHEDRDGSYWMELIGNATITHDIQTDLNAILENKYENLKIKETEEEAAYQSFLKEIDVLGKHQ